MAQKAGLGVPDEVIEATREYEAEQDTFAAFIEEKCIRVASARAYCPCRSIAHTSRGLKNAVKHP